MSERPVPTTRTEEILMHLVDRVDALSDALLGRGGAPAADAADVPDPVNDDTPAVDVVEPAVKPPAKRSASRTKKPVDGS